MKLNVVKGQTSKLVQIFIQDSSSTVGAGLTGLTSGSSGLTAYYYREGAGSATAISLTSMTLGTWTSAGFIVVDGTNLPGLYQLGIPDAALASGANSVVIMLKGATNMAPVVLEIQLVSFDPNDAVRLGLTALPNAAAEAAGGLYTRGTGAGQINQPANGMVDTNVTRFGGTAGTFASGRPEVNTTHVGGTSQTARDIGASVLLSSGTGTGQLDFTSGVVKSNLSQILGTALTETAGQIAAAFKQFFNIASPTSTMNTITTVTTATNLTTNNDKTGYALSSGGVQAIWDALTSALTTTGSIGKRLADDIDATISSRLASGSYTSPPSAATIAAAVWDYLTSAATTVGSLGKLIVDNIDAAISSRLATSGYTAPLSAAGTRSAVGLATANLDTQLSGINTKTTNLPASPAATSDIPSAATVATQVRTELTTELGRVDAAISTRATPAQVNAEVVDALNVDTYAEPGQGAPAATATLAAKINYLYKGWRNKKTQTATQFSLYNDDAATVDQKATISSDGTTTTVGELATGP